MRIFSIVFGLTLVAGANASVARAQDWVVTLGARVRLKPLYEGSENYYLSPHPTLTIRRAGGPHRFEPHDGGSTFALIDADWITAGPMLRFRRSRDDTNEFAGLNRIGRAAEPGAFVDVWPTPWLRGRLEARHGIGGHHGWVGDSGLDLIYTGDRFSASIGPRLGFGDQKYMSTYFGVSQAEADASPKIDRAYSPTGGLRYTGATAAGSYQLDRRWRATVDLTYNRLASKPLASPVVQRLGAGHQVSVGLGLSYRFGAVR